MQKRSDLILQQINSMGRVSVNELSQQFSVSVETIRRDLALLEKKGLLHRVHGGAVSGKTKDIGSSFQARQRSNYDEKHIIAQNAVEYVFEGAVIGLDASSSSWHFAQLIPDIPCTVVTNSMHNITALVNKPNGVFSCIGIDSSGAIWESNELNASVKRKMMDASGQKLLLADSSKFERKNLIRLGELSQIDILFTNSPPPLDLQNYCANHNVLISI